MLPEVTGDADCVVDGEFVTLARADCDVVPEAAADALPVNDLMPLRELTGEFVGESDALLLEEGRREAEAEPEDDLDADGSVEGEDVTDAETVFVEFDVFDDE